MLPLWKSLQADEKVELETGDTLKLGEMELVVEKICSKYSDISCWSVDPTDNPQNEAVGGAASRMMHSASHKKTATPICLHSRYRTRNKQSAKLRCDSKSTLRDPNQETCRICLDCDNESDNPLLNVCQCSGSVRLIHYGCLKTWLNIRTRKVSSENYDYSEYDLTCDLCKTAIKQSVESRGHTYSLYGDEGLTHPPFAVLKLKGEGSRIKQYTVSFHNKDSLVIGKDPKCDLPLSARYLEKEHCELSLRGGALWLHNYSPTYGTFVSLKDGRVGSSLNLMLGNHLIAIERGEQQCCGSVPLELRVPAHQE